MHWSHNCSIATSAKEVMFPFCLFLSRITQKLHYRFLQNSVERLAHGPRKAPLDFRGYPDHVNFRVKLGLRLTFHVTTGRTTLRAEGRVMFYRRLTNSNQRLLLGHGGCILFTECPPGWTSYLSMLEEFAVVLDRRYVTVGPSCNWFNIFISIFIFILTFYFFSFSFFLSWSHSI